MTKSCCWRQLLHASAELCYVAEALLLLLLFFTGYYTQQGQSETRNCDQVTVNQRHTKVACLCFTKHKTNSKATQNVSLGSNRLGVSKGDVWYDHNTKRHQLT